jgi:hypothetical protein
MPFESVNFLNCCDWRPQSARPTSIVATSELGNHHHTHSKKQHERVAPRRDWRPVQVEIDRACLTAPQVTAAWHTSREVLDRTPTYGRCDPVDFRNDTFVDAFRSAANRMHSGRNEQRKQYLFTSLRDL